MFCESVSVGLDGNGGEDGNGSRAIGNVQEVSCCVDHIEIEMNHNHPDRQADGVWL